MEAQEEDTVGTSVAQHNAEHNSVTTEKSEATEAGNAELPQSVTPIPQVQPNNKENVPVGRHQMLRKRRKHSRKHQSKI